MSLIIFLRLVKAILAIAVYAIAFGNETSTVLIDALGTPATACLQPFGLLSVIFLIKL